jgi:hypothetical protein
VNLFIPKLIKIRLFFFFFGSFVPHFQIKLSIHASNFNSRFVSMSELELFLLIRVLTPNFSTMDLVKILERKSKTSHSDRSSHIEDDIMQNHEQKKKVKKSEKPRFYGRNKLFFENPALQPHGCM